MVYYLMTWTFNRWQILLCNTHSEMTLKPCCSRVKPCMTGSMHQVRLDIITCMLTLRPIKRKAKFKDPVSTWSKEVEERPQTLYCFLNHEYFMSNNNKKNQPVGYLSWFCDLMLFLYRLTSPFRFADAFICLICIEYSAVHPTGAVKTIIIDAVLLQCDLD